MITTALLSALVIAGPAMVKAHGHIDKIIIDGVSHAGFNPSYPADYGSTAVRPTDNSDQGFTDFKSGVVACGGASAGTGIETLDVQAGSDVIWHWNTWPESHQGPLCNWMARCPDTGCDGVAADSLDWFKISEDNFDGTNWPGKTLASTLQATAPIPSDIAAGFYLIRHEVIAMHTTGEPQVYPTCFQANVISDGSLVPSGDDLTTFPEAYTINTDFLTWSLYGGDQSLFTPPGPAPIGGGGSAPAPAPAPTSSAATPSASESAAVPEPSDETPAPEPTDETPAPEPTDAAPAPEPTASDAAPVPEPSSSDAVPAPEPTDETPAPEPTDETPAPEPTSSSAAAPEPTASGTTPAPAPAPPAGGELGGAAPAITEENGRFIVNGGSYNDRASAVYASCMYQMNKCKDAANALPNAEVGAALNTCDTQVSTCTSASSSRKRAVVNRYTKRSVGPRF